MTTMLDTVVAKTYSSPDGLVPYVVRIPRWKRSDSGDSVMETIEEV
jgi:hypothetical protein